MAELPPPPEGSVWSPPPRSLAIEYARRGVRVKSEFHEGV
jgi:hypothetical protein